MIEALNSVIGFFERGGLFMWPLLICSIVALTTIILRGFALREKQVMPLVIGSVNPGKVIDPQDIDSDLVARRNRVGQILAHKLGQGALDAKDFVAAAEHF